MSWTTGTIVFVVVCVLFSFVKRAILQRRNVFQKKHAFITGGSQGIGLSVAIKLASRGASVTIIARNKTKLADAVETIKANCKEPYQKVIFVAADVTNPASVKAAVDEATSSIGPIDFLFCAAGASFPGYFLEQEVEVFQKSMTLNYMGVVHCIKAVSPSMVERRTGHIIAVASACAAISFVGYSTYSPSKFALRGLCDTLRNELKGFGVQVSIAYPPDTETPGFQQENTSKPTECHTIGGGGGAYRAEAVAECMLASVAAGDYHLQSPDLVQNALVSTTSGVTPRVNVPLELLLQPLLGLATQGFLLFMDHVAAQYPARVLARGGSSSSGSSSSGSSKATPSNKDKAQ